MGTSSAEINDEITTTRQHLDANLDVLEKRATSGIKRAGMLGGIGLAAGLVVGGIAYLVFRRTHKPTVRDRVQDAMPDFTDFQKEVKKRFGSRPFKIVITSADADTSERGSIWESTARKVAPTIVTSAASAIMAAALRRRGSSEPDTTAE
jgi:hypothetical protein